MPLNLRPPEPTSRRTLALDLATITGWATRVSGLLVSGTQSFTPRRGDSPGMRYLRFTAWLREVHEARPFDVVAYERPHLRGGHAATVLVGLETHLHSFCAERGIEHCTVETNTLKKFATGSGKASKTDMIRAAEKLLRRPPIDDNEADAVLVLQWAEREYS